MNLICLALNNNLAVYGDEPNTIKDYIHKKRVGFPDGNMNDTNYVIRVIHYMYQTDQEARKKIIPSIRCPELKILITEMDQFHTQKMKEILNIHGWITISRFGKEADHETWLLVQHSDHDPFFQAACAFLLSNLAQMGETDKSNHAYLYDRVCLKFKNLGMKQRYGTQVTIPEEGEISLSPYEGTLQQMDIHRKQAGLEPIAHYLKTVEMVYKK